MTWKTREDAIRAWVKAATGFADPRVIWSDQNGARPDGPFATIRIGDRLPVGVVDQVDAFTDLGRDVGEEIELRATGVREFSVSVQLFGGPSNADGSAHDLAAKCQLALALPSVRSELTAAGLSPFDNGRVRNVPELLGTAFEARAVLDARFYVVETLSEFTGYIASVEAEDFMGPPNSGTEEEIDI